MEANNQAHPEGVEGVQGDEEAESSTSLYKSLNSIEDDVIGIPYLKRKVLLSCLQSYGSLP